MLYLGVKRLALSRHLCISSVCFAYICALEILSIILRMYCFSRFGILLVTCFFVGYPEHMQFKEFRRRFEILMPSSKTAEPVTDEKLVSVQFYINFCIVVVKLELKIFCFG